MCFIQKAIITIEFPTLTDFEYARPLFEHIERMITRETSMKPHIEIIGVKK